ncbi:coiled-coil domain-containing protein [Sesbania bispinosa]|nr:coiled-coil domain-containing protein [Sesbania bispinosa]
MKTGDEQSEAPSDLLDYNSYQSIMKHLGDILNEKLELESVAREMKKDGLSRNLHLENENEILVLKESLHQAEEALAAARSELHEKANDLEHSEQRVSSIREKLGIAVAKGKGLVVQRDGLKQSLSETSSELERCLQELKLKDTRLHELETKLTTYAEAGERVEALESELSYIRNSANALRESFLLKDSMLQRIEEVLEDLDLPEQFHSSDIIEKIDWLVRSVAGNSLPMNDWEQKDSAVGGSYSDAVIDGKKQLSSRWEELVDRIDMPSHLRSMETEDRIEWVGRALAEANHHIDSLQLKIEKFDSYCGLLNADLEESQRRVSTLQADLRALTSERQHLSEKVEALTYECEKLSVQTREAELENEKLNNEITSLKDKLEQQAEIEEQILIIDGKIRKLRDLVGEALKGKLLVQQRDSLKQTIEEMTTEMERLKSEINNRERTLAEHEQKLRQLSTYPDRLEALESERLLLKNHLEETENHLQEKEYSLKLILNKLGEIEVGGEGHINDPLKKLEWVGKLCSDLHDAVASLEQESRKSKRASELLLAELNEVQERNDGFQEELGNVAAELVDLRRARDSAEAGKLEALSHLEKLSSMHEEEKRSHFSEIMELKSSMNQVCKSFGEVQNLLANAFSMDLESFRNLEAGLESCVKGNNAANVVDSSVSKEHAGIFRRSSDNKKSSVYADSWSDFDTIDHYDDNTIVEIFHLFGLHLQKFLMEVSSLKERIDMHSSLAFEQDKALSKLMANIQREMTSQRESCETMKKEATERDRELVALRGNIAYLYEACINSVIVLENGKAELVGKTVESSDIGINLKHHHLMMKYLRNEMKATITDLQRELQEKDVQRDRICSDLVKQIKDAEDAANSYSQDLQSLRMQENNLKKQVEVLEAERKILEQRVNELQDSQVIAAELEDKMRSQTNLLAAKEQEIEELMHALDEEEMQMEEKTKKIAELEKVVQLKNQEIENLESSRSKVMKKLSITVSKFDELHHLSASLLSEVEKLQSQLQEKDSEISFLRQEVTRCTNDVLLASQTSNQRSSDEIIEFLMWVDTILSRDGMNDIPPDVKSNSQNQRAVAESKDAMLQVERSKVEELNRKAETLEMSLHEKESQLNLLEGVEETGKRVDSSSEILEVEPVVNDGTATGAFVTPQVRSLRKGNSDHIAIAVEDVDPRSTSRIEDEEDDKVHGFKSLTSSKIVPRFTRPLTDLIDGLWVSCDRTLMRQPVLRLGIIMYWAIMHALLAFFVV